jgi:hypothetical protein
MVDRAQEVRVGGSGIDGHGVFAARDLQPGETVLRLALLDGWFVAEHADHLRALDQEVGT